MQLFGQFTALGALRPGAYVPVTLETATPVLFTDVLVERSNLSPVQPATGFYLPERDERAFSASPHLALRAGLPRLSAPASAP